MRASFDSPREAGKDNLPYNLHLGVKNGCDYFIALESAHIWHRTPEGLHIDGAGIWQVAQKETEAIRRDSHEILMQNARLRTLLEINGIAHGESA